MSGASVGRSRTWPTQWWLTRVEIAIPALRERERDVVAIARDYLANTDDLATRRRGLTRNAAAVLLRHSWPGA